MPPRNYLNRPLAEGIRTVGFRKWYERELLSSHAHMLIALLSTIALMATLELFQGGSMGDKLLNVVLFILSGALALWSLRRYLYLLSHAETVADQANCPQCTAYGRLSVVEEDRRNGRLLVRCRQCGEEWTLLP
jgi:membrane protein implicated in regulation of membrane protease activity